MKRIIGVFLLWLGSAALTAQDAGLYLRYGRWNSDTTGTASTFHSLADVAKDLALDDTKPTGYGILYRGQKHRFSLEVYSSSTSEEVTLEAPLDFGGRHFDAGAAVRTSMKIRSQEAEYWYPLVTVPTLRTGLVLGGEMYRVETRVADAKVMEDQFIPYVGLGVSLLTPRTKVYVDFEVVAGQYQDSTHISGRIETGVDLTQSIGIYFGLRKVKFEIGDNDKYQYDLDSSSVYIGAHLHL
jgi:hypothetical protein